MPLSSVTRVSDGIQKQYDFDFGYLRKSHIFVFVNNTLRSFKWLGPFQIELLNFPQPDDVVTIRRLTDRVNRITTFADGQTILAEDLNASDLQTFYIAQEMLDQIEDGILTGEVSVVGAGYITVQWIQEQLEANIAGSTQFQAVNDALDQEALDRANAIAAEASARAAEIAAEASARGAAIFALEEADLEAGQRLDILEADVNDAETGIKARVGTLETVTADLENNKADVSVVTALEAATASAAGQTVTIDEALAAETAARTSQISTANSRIDGAEADITGLQVTVTNLSEDKAEASDLAALTARVGTAEAEIVSEATARVSGDAASSVLVSQLGAAIRGETQRVNLLPSAYWIADADDKVPFFALGGVLGGTSVLNPHTGKTSRKYTGTGTSNYIRIGFVPDYTQTNMTLPPGRYAYKFSFRAQAGFSGISLRIRDTSYASPVNINHSADSGVDTIIQGVFDIPSVGVQQFHAELQFNYSTAENQEGKQVWIYRAQIEAVPNSVSEPGEWSGTGQNATITELREALATGSSSSARLLLSVNTTTNVATIEAYAAEGDGVWNGSEISFTADTIRLNGNVLLNGTVLTASIAPNAVSDISRAYTAANYQIASPGAGWYTAQTLTLTSTGSPMVISTAVALWHNGSNILASTQFRIRRDGVTIYEGGLKGFGTATSATYYGDFSATIDDEPSAGSRTYTVEFKCTSISVVNVSQRFLSVTRLKR